MIICYDNSLYMKISNLIKTCGTVTTLILIMVLYTMIVLRLTSNVDCSSCCRYIDAFMHVLDPYDSLFVGSCYSQCSCIYT